MIPFAEGIAIMTWYLRSRAIVRLELPRGDAALGPSHSSPADGLVIEPVS